MVLEHFPDEVKNHGWIEVIFGSMFSGKTEELILRLRRAQFANQKILLIKPKVDDRYHKENVVSHQGNSFDAICVKNALEILRDLPMKHKLSLLMKLNFSMMELSTFAMNYRERARV